MSATPLQAIWQTSLEPFYIINSAPAISHDTIYINAIGGKSDSDGSNADVRLIAFNRTSGRQLWHVRIGIDYDSSPIVAGNTIFTGSGDAVQGSNARLYAIDHRQGATQWYFETPGAIRATPLIIDNTLYFGSFDHHLYAIDRNTGELRWRFEAGGAISATPAVANGTLYINTIDGLLYAIDLYSGRPRWSSNIGVPTPASPTIVDGHLYLPSNRRLHSFECASGKERWHIDISIGTRFISQPVAHRGTIYLGSDQLCAFDRHNGKPLWKADIKCGGSPAISGETVYIGSTDGGLYAFDRNTGEQLGCFKTPIAIHTTPSIVEDMLCFGRGSWLYALKCDPQHAT